MPPILVVLDSDLTGAQPALAKAIALARRTNAPLALYANAYNPMMLRDAGADETAIASAGKALLGAWEKSLRQRLDALDAADTELHLFCHADDEHTLAATVLSLHPAMIVVHAEQVEAPRRLLFTPRHWRLVRKAPCPVLVVSDTPWPEPLTVTMAVDTDHGRGKPEALDNDIVSTGRELAGWLGAAERLVNVVEYPDETLVMLAGDALPVTLSDTSALRQFYRARLDSFCASIDFPRAQAELLEGAPHRALAADSDTHPGIQVIGNVHRGPLKRLFLGATAEKVLHHSSTDVMVVKPADFTSPWHDMPGLDAYQRING